MAYTKENLQKISFFRLKQLGREKGVKAPTSLTKQALIQAIIDIEAGKIEPCFNTSNRGRPSIADNLLALIENSTEDKALKIKNLIAEFEKELLEIILE